jgi:hypothetical protein
MVVGGHVKVTRLWGMVRRLLGDVVCALSIFQVPVASENFTKNWVQGLLDASTRC